MRFTLSTSRYYYPEVSDRERLTRLFGFVFDEGDCVDLERSPVVELSTLEDLLDLQKKADCRLIVSEARIEIYDGYRE